MKITLTPEQKNELQQLAELPGQTPLSIATIMQLDYTSFIIDLMDTDCDIHKAYYAGKAILSIGFQKKVMQLATQGSGPAQTLVHKILKEAELNAMREYYG
jgi:hypothetical protein